MNDFFTEHLIKRKKSTGEIIIIILVILLAAILSFFTFFTMVRIPGVGQFAFLAVAAICWAAYLFISTRNVEYEYIVTNGELDIDKIISKSKRKRIITVASKDIEQIMPISSFKPGNISKILDVSANNKNLEEYVLLTTSEGQRTEIIFNPSRKMMQIFKKFRPGAVTHNFEE